MNGDLSNLINNLSHLTLIMIYPTQILVHKAIVINDDLSQLTNNLSPLALHIWLYSVSIASADLFHLMNNLSHLALQIMLYSQWKFVSEWWSIYPTL